MSRAEKELVIAQVLAGDKSLGAEACRAHCFAGLPDQEVKAQVWREITDPGFPDNPIVKQAKMAGFYSTNQLDLIEPYFEKFIDALRLQREMNSYKGMCQFFHGMLPRIEVQDKYIFKLYELLHETPDSEAMFQATLKDGLDILFRTRNIVRMAEQKLSTCPN